MTDTEPRTAKATAATVRRGQETKAAVLREAGWLVVPPEVRREVIDRCALEIKVDDWSVAHDVLRLLGLSPSEDPEG